MTAPTDIGSFLSAQRWFGGKGKQMTSIDIVATLKVVPGCNWEIVNISYEDGSRGLYQVPRIAGNEGLSDANFRDAIFDLLCKNQALHGPVSFEAIQPPERVSWSRLSTIEQSNSAVNYGDVAFLKFFRQLEGGINPELEILGHLTKIGTVRVPKLHASAKLELSGKIYVLAVLLEMVQNQGNGWERAMEASKTDRDFEKSAALLGKRTAEMHLALSAEAEDFGTGKSKPCEANEMLTSLQAELVKTRVLLASRLDSLNANRKN